MSLTKEQVNEVMTGIHESWRYYWCGAGICGCSGCANVSGQASTKGVTREQWVEWVLINPQTARPQNCIDSMQTLPHEFQKVLDDNFWEIVLK